MNRIVSLALAAGLASCVSSDQLRRQEYDAQYRKAEQLCGRPDAAFQDGYNAGYAGGQMRSEWAAMCQPTVQAQASAAYQNGFLQGANNAPLRVVHTITPMRSSISTTTTSQCTFDSDCGGDGFHCRDHACMGYGAIGERCVFNEDCADDHCFGGTCHE